MKLISVDYYLDWPVSIKLKNLREFIIANLEKKRRFNSMVDC